MYEASCPGREGRLKTCLWTPPMHASIRTCTGYLRRPCLAVTLPTCQAQTATQAVASVCISCVQGTAIVHCVEISSICGDDADLAWQ